jgi:2-iminobutanoate/2-iminopropanoate deaminase
MKRLLLLLVVAGAAACAPHAMHRHVISTPQAPEAIGPYSQAVAAGDLLFLSGQLPIDPETGDLKADASIEEQTALVISNLRAVLEAAGMTLDHVVSTQVFMQDLNEFSRMNAVYAKHFTGNPARATVEVARLPLDVKIEIAAIAVRTRK